MFDSLSARYARDRVFMDRDSITPGVDFVERIDEALASCDAAVILIGEDWVKIAAPEGRRRLDDPADYVRTEVAAALARPDIRVVPVLVGGATMPSASELPEDLRPLSRLNAIELSDERWQFDVRRLIDALPEDRRSVRRRLAGMPLAARLAAAALVLAAIAIAAFTLPRSSHRAKPQQIFSDSFAKTSQAWSPGAVRAGRVTFRSGALWLTAKENHFLSDTYREQVGAGQGTMSVAVDASGDEGPDAATGVSCAKDVHNDYLFGVTRSGYYVYRVENDSATVLTRDERGPGFLTGRVNHIAAACSTADGSKTQLSLMLNGKKLAVLTDDKGIGIPGLAGVFVDNLRGAVPATRAFDNFAVAHTPPT